MLFPTLATFRFFFAYLKYSPRQAFGQVFLERFFWSATSTAATSTARRSFLLLIDCRGFDTGRQDFSSLLEAPDIVKDFGGTRALDHVNLSAR